MKSSGIFFIICKNKCCFLPFFIILAKKTQFSPFFLTKIDFWYNLAYIEDYLRVRNFGDAHCVEFQLVKCSQLIRWPHSVIVRESVAEKHHDAGNVGSPRFQDFFCASQRLPDVGRARDVADLKNSNL